jgi:hypothetical protein
MIIDFQVGTYKGYVYMLWSWAIHLDRRLGDRSKLQYTSTHISYVAKSQIVWYL